MKAYCIIAYCFLVLGCERENGPAGTASVEGSFRESSLKVSSRAGGEYLDLLSGRWESNEEANIELEFDYQVLRISTKGLWRDLDGMSFLVTEAELGFIFRNDLFLIRPIRKDGEINRINILREVPLGSENYEKIIFSRSESY